MMSQATLQYQLPLRFDLNVLALQNRLVALNHLPASEATGLFGPETRRAVQRFQEFLKRTPTGVADGQTQADIGMSGANIIRFRPIAPTRDPVWKDPLPKASPKRIILHWTAGGAKASDLDRKHYHFLVEQDGTIVKGVHGIDANDAPKTGKYAAHTWKTNTKSIGLSLCGMVGAIERPFNGGSAPFKNSQLEVLTQLVAQLCAHYRIPVTRKTVLGHGEVQALLGITQKQKWDPMVLPWDPAMPPREVGDMMRAMVQAEFDLLTSSVTSDDHDSFGGPLDLALLGKVVNGGALDFDCATWTHLPSIADALGWSIASHVDIANSSDYEVKIDGEAYHLPVRQLETQDQGRQNGFILVSELAAALNLEAKLSPNGAIIALDGKIGGALPDVDGTPRRQVTIRPGDTLSAIARRELGDPNAWKTLLTKSGKTFTKAMAQNLRPGDVVIVPGKPVKVAAPAKVTLDGAVLSLFEDAAHDAAWDDINRDAARTAASFIVPACFEHGVTDLSHIAYIFATAQHETNFGRQMKEIWRNSAAQQKYETNGANSKKGDGQLFKGRGYVQLTFRANYQKFADELKVDIVKDPSLAAEPKIAAQILVVGMQRVGYRSRKLILDAYGVDGAFDFIKARQIVNADMNKEEARYGMTRGKGIAVRANKFRVAFSRFSLGS